VNRSLFNSTCTKADDSLPLELYASCMKYCFHWQNDDATDNDL